MAETIRARPCAGCFPCLVWVSATSVDGSASWRQGAEAEGWTAEELEALGTSWRIEHDVPFPVWRRVVDVDHIAVGPHGVLVVETKWTGHAVDLSATRLAPEVMRAVGQVEDNAGRFRGLIRRVDPDTPVIPIVVYWGGQVAPPRTPVRREGDVRVVAGKRADAWRPLLYRQRLDIETIDRLADHVHRWRVAQEQKSIGGAVTSRLRPADLLGRISLGLAALVTLLLTASLASNHVDEFFGQLLGSVHSAILVTLLFLPLVAALGGLAFVWIAWQLNPEVAWVRRLIPLGTWTAGFTGLMIAGS